MIIAECGHNWNGDLDLAKLMIGAAKDAGADVVKCQLYDTDSIVTQDHRAYTELKESQLTKAQWFDLVSECKRVGIEFLASVFDAERVAWCEEVDMKFYKIASRSIYNEELLEAVMATGKDVLISLGMVNGKGIPKIPNGKYLYCVAQYPAPLNALKLGKVDWRYYAGISDHTEGIEAAMVAIARGADIIEKHFTIDRSMPGCDQAASMMPTELAQLVDFSRKVREMA